MSVKFNIVHPTVNDVTEVRKNNVGNSTTMKLGKTKQRRKSTNRRNKERETTKFKLVIFGYN